MPSRPTVVLMTLLVATPAVIFWLWLVVLPARVAILCPEDCSCDPGGYYVNCLGLLKNNITSIIPTDVRRLLFHLIRITSLEKDRFISKGLTELEYLDVVFCGLERIELGAFNGLTKLTYLTISDNKISEILSGTFQNLIRLQELHLRYNRIQHLQVGVFLGLINLKYIDLRANELQYLHPDMFVGLHNLEHLDLSRNCRLQIPTDRHFINTQSLSRLNISNCNVSSVSVETFANVTALELLDLSYNNLMSVDINILKALPKLSALYLYGNPLQCDCQLQEVCRWCQDHIIQTASGETAPECATPSEVQGMWWGVLEKGQCLQGNIHYYGDYKNASYSYTAVEDTDLYNYTYSFLQIYEVPVITVPFIFGTTGNVILLIIITCNKDMRTVPNMYILNLVVSDMIYLMVHFAESCADTIPDEWQYHDFMCKFLPFCRRLSVGLSAYSVAVLSIQRYRVTVNPLHVRVSSQKNMASYCAYSLWSVDFGCFIRRSFCAVRAFMSSNLS
jgi:Leucine-rich repeat (LRR) protein